MRSFRLQASLCAQRECVSIGASVTDLSTQINRVARDNEELKKELDVLQLYLQNLLGPADAKAVTVGPGVLSSFVRSEFQVK